MTKLTWNQLVMTILMANWLTHVLLTQKLTAVLVNFLFSAILWRNQWSTAQWWTKTVKWQETLRYQSQAQEWSMILSSPKNTSWFLIILLNLTPSVLLRKISLFSTTTKKPKHNTDWCLVKTKTLPTLYGLRQNPTLSFTSAMDGMK